MAERVRLGEFWLAPRTDRSEWAICWNDKRARTRRRKSTGIEYRGESDPPVEAQQKLAEHFAENGKPEKASSNAQVSVARLLTTWLTKEGSKRKRAAEYGYAVRHLTRWIQQEGGSMTVEELIPESVDSYAAMRIGEGVKGETVHSEWKALGTALNYSWKSRMIPSVPYIGKVAPELRSPPKDVEYDMEEIAAILEASYARVDRQHVHLFTMIMLSTHGRVEAVTELDADSQIKQNRIHFNAPGRLQTIKKRAIVPVAPTLAPWLPDSGKVIMYRVPRKDGTMFERPTHSIKTAFRGVLDDAGHYEVVGHKQGKNGEEIEVRKYKGSPNTLRHSIHTYLQTVGVPQAQIDAAAGHSSEKGAGRSYTHLRPEYLTDFIDAIEAYWEAMDGLTKVHRRSLVGPKVYDLKTGLAVK